MTALRQLILFAVLLGSVTSAPAQDYRREYYKAYRFGHGERPQRYGNTASFFNYDNRDDQRDLPTNGVFPGNFAGNPLLASVGAAGWLGTNPAHQPYPYPSQTYAVDVRGLAFCQPYTVDRAGDLIARRRYHACLPR
jgi:hypothetical protein